MLQYYRSVVNLLGMYSSHFVIHVESIEMPYQ